ncbi:NAD(P)-dependent oxidoreductase [uncultured Enterovirga sp.]|uniref:NAD(P)-dependent oxidoreductase n=1 Tax=uncultured Enterovirga sp. TaxID=2026352 RepID=UPI0035CA2E96
MSEARYAFVGTGAMGHPMASCLLKAGLPLTVHSRTREKAEPLLAAGAAWADSPGAAADAADIVLTCVSSNEDTEAVLFGPDGVASRRVDCVVDFSTSGPQAAERFGEALAKAGIGFVDAPVTGGTPRAASGTLTVIASGAPEAIERARPALEAVGSNIFVVGPRPGQAQTVKVINNMLNYLAMAATSEAMVLGVKAGLDPKIVLDVLNTGTGKNSATEVKFPKSVLPRSFNYGATNYTVDKDLHLFLDEAARVGVKAPIATHLSDLWHGWAEQHPKDDITTIVKLFEGWSGVEVRGSA